MRWHGRWTTWRNDIPGFRPNSGPRRAGTIRRAHFRFEARSRLSLYGGSHEFDASSKNVAAGLLSLLRRRGGFHGYKCVGKVFGKTITAIE